MKQTVTVDLKERQIFFFHGTTNESAKRILREGFKPDCWFARNMADAVLLGGNTVLMVEFEPDEVPDGWQFHVLEAYPAGKIKKVFTVIECHLKENEAFRCQQVKRAITIK